MTIAAGAAPVGVIGAGPMADGIAGLAAQAGHELHRCTATTIASLPACALVVDASRADLDETCEIFEELGRHQPTTTILGCASDELTVDDVAPMTVRPARVVGLHFVAPVPDNPIVEVVRCQATDADTVIGVMGLMTQWGRTPVRCASAPGLIVERLWRVVVGEAERVVDEGLADPATVDACLVAAGLPEGPLARADRLGLADELRLTRALWLQTQRHPRYAPTPLLRSLVSAGTLGVATGRGFLTYAASAAGVVEPVEVPDARLAEKLLALPITLNPGQRCSAARRRGGRDRQPGRGGAARRRHRRPGRARDGRRPDRVGPSARLSPGARPAA